MLHSALQRECIFGQLSAPSNVADAMLILLRLFSHLFAAWLSFVLNARLLKTNLLPIIKIRAKHEKKKFL